MRYSNSMNVRLLPLLLCAACFVSGCATPAAVPTTDDVTVVRDVVRLEGAGERPIDVTLFTAERGCDDCTLIVFSHGAFSAPERYTAILEPWVRSGFVVAAPMHVDSELHAARADYSGNDWVRTRVEDYERSVAALRRDGVGRSDVRLSGTVIAAGHSFGALIAQLAAGAELDPAVGVASAATDARPIGVIALSPPGPMDNYMSATGWSKVERPSLVVTGTADVLPNFVPEWELHTVSYDAAPAGSAYLAVFDDIDHYFNGAFGRPGPDGYVSNTETAMLNTLVVDFMRALERGALPGADAWQGLSGPGVRLSRR